MLPKHQIRAILFDLDGVIAFTDRYHYLAWKKGMKSLYYCRSLSIQRADTVSEKAVRPDEFTGIPVANDQGLLPLVAARAKPIDYEECLACQ